MFEPVKNYDYIALTIIDDESSEVFNSMKKTLITDYKGESVWTFFNNTINISKIMGSGQTMSGAINRRFVIWEPASKKNKTIFLSHSVDGCETIINASLSKSVNFIKVSVSKYKVKTFNMLEYRKNLKKRVILSYLNYSKWEFVAKGDILSFENKEYYKRRAIKDRLNYEIIDEYLKASGWDLNNPDFWKSKKDAIYFIEKHKNKVDD